MVVNLARAVTTMTLQPHDDAVFIVTTPARQSLEGKRKLIRSQVMRGKNRKKRPSRPLLWMSDVQTQNTPRTISIPAKFGGELSFTGISADLGPDMLDALWKRKQRALRTGQLS